MTGKNSTTASKVPPGFEEAVAILEDMASGVSVSPETQILIDAVSDERIVRSEGGPTLEPVSVEDVTKRWSKSAFHSVIRIATGCHCRRRQQWPHPARERADGALVWIPPS